MKIGIIGGGISGLTAAWLLEQEHEVILFEKHDKPGGHAHTFTVELGDQKIPVEVGFEFFNTSMFPHLCKLLQILNIGVRPYLFTYTFFNQDKDAVIVLPPIQDQHIFWSSLTPSAIANFLQLAYTMYKGQRIVGEHITALTLGDFLDTLWVTDGFIDNFFSPLFSAGWGLTPQEFKKLSAFNIFSWLLQNKPMGLKPAIWFEFTDTVTDYIATLTNQLTKTTVRTHTTITHVAYTGTHYIVQDHQGNKTTVDHLVIATNAEDARTMLNNCPHAASICTALGTIEYIDATLAVHGDTRFMPHHRKYWSVANVCYNHERSALTIYKKSKTPIPLLRSWIIEGFPTPEKIYHTSYFRHAKPTPAYFAVQDAVAKAQGRHNLWFAGLYTQGIDSHESAVRSAITIARRLVPNSSRLQQMLTVDDLNYSL